MQGKYRLRQNGELLHIFSVKLYVSQCLSMSFRYFPGFPASIQITLISPTPSSEVFYFRLEEIMSKNSSQVLTLICEGREGICRLKLVIMHEHLSLN